MSRSFLAFPFALALLVGVLAKDTQMPIFQYDNQPRDLAESPLWQAGDPWDQHYTREVGYDDRDQQLTDHVNADYIQRPFTASVTQNGAPIASTGTATFTRGARVQLEINLVIGAVCTVATEIKITPTGIPDGIVTTTLGTFFYLRTGVSFITGIATWNGTDIQLLAGGVRTNFLGSDPSFATAVNDGLFVNISYHAAP